MLVIRGELLKKYPTAVIYAQRAALGARRTAASTRARSASSSSSPPPRRPTRRATRSRRRSTRRGSIPTSLLRLRPDHRRGARRQRRATRRRPGLVLRASRSARASRGSASTSTARARSETVNDLAWDDARRGGAEGAFVAATAPRHDHARAARPRRPREEATSATDDLKVVAAPVSAARWAYILLPGAGDRRRPRRRDAARRGRHEPTSTRSAERCRTRNRRVHRRRTTGYAPTPPCAPRRRARRRGADRRPPGACRRRTPAGGRQRRPEAADAAYRGAREQLAAGLELAVPVIDPRRLVERLSADFPVLLFPVRLETRFMAVTDDAGARTEQLWVRIFPDTCSIDSFGATSPNPRSRTPRRTGGRSGRPPGASTPSGRRGASSSSDTGPAAPPGWSPRCNRPTPSNARRSPAIRRPSRRSTLSTPCRRRGTGPRERRCCPNGSCS